MRRAFVLTLAVTAVLVPACKEQSNEPVTKDPPTRTNNPPPPKGELPTWDEVASKSPHPPGATNPPSPFLIVSPDGKCFVKWEGGMLKSKGDRVEACEDKCGTQVQCPPKATKLLADHATAAASGSASAAPKASK